LSEHAEVVRQLFADWTRGDFGQGLAHFAPDLHFVVEGNVSPNPGEWDGVEGMRDAWRSQLSVWEDYRAGVIEHLLESGETVVAFNRLHGRGKHSGIDMESRLWAAIFEFRDGKVARLTLTDARGALERVGLLD
jgi:ketosteroid isomerase-like protein